MGDEEAHKLKAVELLQVISEHQSHGTRITDEDRSKARAQFSSEPWLRLAVTTHFSEDLDKEEDVVCDALLWQTSALAQPACSSFSASFLPMALKEVMSSVVHGATDLKIPLHKYVIAANNLMADYHKLGLFEVQLPDLRAPSRYHKLKPYYVHFDLKKFDNEEVALAKPRVFSGDIVNPSVSSAIFVGAFSCFVYFIEGMDTGAHLDMISLCMHMLCHGIKPLEFKVQVIVGRLREQLDSSSHRGRSRGPNTNNTNSNSSGSGNGRSEEEALAQMLVANLVEVYNVTSRISISSSMYIVMSQALLFVCQSVSHPLVLEVCSYAICMMKERAKLDMNCLGVMLSQCLSDIQEVNKAK
jgi:hypothetical protein